MAHKALEPWNYLRAMLLIHLMGNALVEIPGWLDPGRLQSDLVKFEDSSNLTISSHDSKSSRLIASKI